MTKTIISTLQKLTLLNLRQGKSQVSQRQISEELASGTFFLKSDGIKRRVASPPDEPVVVQVISYQIGVPGEARTPVVSGIPRSPGATFAPSQAS